MRRATHESDERVTCKIARAMARIGSKFDARTNDGCDGETMDTQGGWTRLDELRLDGLTSDDGERRGADAQRWGMDAEHDELLAKTSAQ